MKELRGKVAVVTGGASGIGRALADAFAAEGMRLVLADIEKQALDPDGKTEGTLRERLDKIARRENPTAFHQL